MCLASLYRQNISEDQYEVICINDCSPDHSREIVLKYQQQHSNLRLVEHKENKCIGGARNTGIDAAQGEYLWFIDSDDLIDDNCLKAVIDRCTKNKVDVFMFNFEKVDISGHLIEKVLVTTNTDVKSGLQFIKQTFENDFGYHFGYVWRQIFRTAFLQQKNIRFPERIYWEDTVFMPKTLAYAQTVCSVDKCYYKYRINPTSICNVYKEKLNADSIFQFAFNTGWELMQFADDLSERDYQLSQSVETQARNYFNSFIPKLLKAPLSQKTHFNKLIRSNQSLVKLALPYLTGIARITCKTPVWGFSIILLVTPLYHLRSTIKRLLYK
jgi:glycosyltransferase involved in cell wall biosynthesis